MFWGLTPALNLFEEFDQLPDELNILLVGGADCRHVLKTLSRRHKYKSVKINFYLMESCSETIAKQLLLLNVALQSQEALGLTQRTRIFMELYGNTLLRPSTARFLTSTATNLVKMITDLEYMKEAMPNVDLDLKYKERDYMENLLKFWCSGDEFNVSDCWDRRLRRSLGVRYDNKIGAFDWDLHMRLRSVGGHQICNQEYHSFRSLGLAFTWLEFEASKPNRSMVCGVISNGEKYGHYGYLGEMETGPFVAYGLSCEDETFTKKTNDTNTHRSTDVTERNLKQIFHELLTGEDYVHQQTSSFTLGHVSTMGNNAKVIDVGPEESSANTMGSNCVTLENVTINFISMNQLISMKHKKRFENCFHLLYFNSCYMKHFDSEIVSRIAKENSVLIVENQLFVVAHRKQELEEYEKSVCEKTESLKCKRRLKFDLEKDCYLKYVLKEEHIGENS